MGLIYTAIFIFIISSQLFIKTWTNLVLRQRLFESQEAHDQRSSLRPRIEIFLYLHNKVRIRDDFGWHLAHFIVWYLPFLKYFKHLLVRGRLKLLESIKTKGHMDFTTWFNFYAWFVLQVLLILWVLRYAWLSSVNEKILALFETRMIAEIFDNQLWLKFCHIEISLGICIFAIDFWLFLSGQLLIVFFWAFEFAEDSSPAAFRSLSLRWSEFSLFI